ncbi:MAG: type II secretion system protein N [Desulfoarculaceae bacterium]|nr:type II secretion system protein N [Desulfoarculaceae bacterium]
MMNRKRLVLLAVVAYAFFLLWYAPAQLVFGFLGKGVTTPAGLLQCRNLEGNWREGVARDGQLGRVQLKEIRWTLRPWSLLTGSLSASISAQTGYGSFMARLNRGIRSLSLRELEADIDIASLSPLMKATGIQLDGKVLGSMSDFTVRQGRITAAQGQWVWHDASVTSPRQNQLGTITIDLTTSSNETRAIIGDKGGPLQLDGLVVLAGDGRYSLTARMGARQSELDELISSLAFLGTKGDDGLLHLSLNGDLPPLRP